MIFAEAREGSNTMLDDMLAPLPIAKLAEKFSTSSRIKSSMICTGAVTLPIPVMPNSMLSVLLKSSSVEIHTYNNYNKYKQYSVLAGMPPGNTPSATPTYNNNY